MTKILRFSEKWFQRGLWLIALIFAAFLIGLGGLIIKDLPQVERPLDSESFLDQKIVLPLKQKLTALEIAQKDNSQAIEKQHLLLTAAQHDTAQIRQSFATSVATRHATANAADNLHVLNQSRKLDEATQRERTIEKQLEEFEQKALALEQEKTPLIKQLSKLEKTANLQRVHAQQKQDLRIFGVRLAFTLPLLLIAGWLFKKQRTTTYWPFAWGFIFFALFTFFIELVPYLPSYGGYVRYGVGIALTIAIGHYAIRGLRHYLEQQGIAEQQAEHERRQSLDYELSHTRIEKHVCPSCERPFNFDDATTNFCQHCGLCIFNDCTKCRIRKNAFSRFCPSCGANGKSSESTEALA